LLNEQLIFLLREIALCRNQLKDAQKNIVSSHYYSPNNNEPLNQQLELKIQENDTLKKQIAKLYQLTVKLGQTITELNKVNNVKTANLEEAINELGGNI
jgi:hypothetical protein